MQIIKTIISRWKSPDGYQKVLVIAFPLILSTGSWSVQHFVDRVFLTWYSPETIAAAMPSGILNYTLMSFFIGAAGYVTTFIAQYYGAEQKDRIGTVIWQGIYFSVIGGLFIMCTAPFARLFFSSLGHEPVVAMLEADYFIYLCPGAFPAIAASAVSGFYAGQGKTWPVMWISVGTTVINLVLDYFLIFGYFLFPEMGIKGAAIATDIAAYSSLLAYSFLIFSKRNDVKYNVLSGWRFDDKLFARLIRFGVPSGMQFLLDTSGWTIFIILVGTLGTVPLAASNIAFSINTLAFMPMIGISIAVSVLVGQNLGADNPESAQTSAWSGFHVAFIYMLIVALLYVVMPGVFLNPFISGSKYTDAESIKKIAEILLRFVAAYTLFDTFNLIFGSALKGAGDTKYVMLSNLAISMAVLIIPAYVSIKIFRNGIFSAWYIASAYILVLAMNFLFRFNRGKWKSMRVIEEKSLAIPGCCPPEVPTVE